MAPVSGFYSLASNSDFSHCGTFMNVIFKFLSLFLDLFIHYVMFVIWTASFRTFG